MKTSTHYSLRLPEDSDVIDVKDITDDFSKIDTELYNHTSGVVNGNTNGVHGMRYYNSKLQYKSGSSWNDISTTFDNFANVKRYHLSKDNNSFSQLGGGTNTSTLFVAASYQGDGKIGFKIETIGSGGVTYTRTCSLSNGQVGAFECNGSFKIGVDPSFYVACSPSITLKSYRFDDIGSVGSSLSCTFASGYTSGIIYIAGSNYMCLLGDTMITMADGSEKRIDEIVVGDEVLSIDADTGELYEAKVTFTDHDAHNFSTEYDKWTFSDGTVVKTVSGHQFYNASVHHMVDINTWSIGNEAYTKNGTYTTLVSHEVVKEPCNHYNIRCGNKTNYFANGLLAGDNKNGISKLF